MLNRITIMLVCCITICGFNMPVNAAKTLTPGILNKIQSHLVSSIQSPQCVNSAAYLASIVNYDSFYHDTLPKDARLIYNDAEKKRMEQFLQQRVLTTLQQFLCNKNLVKYDFNKTMYQNHHKKLLYFGGFDTKHKQYFAFIVLLKRSKKKIWQAHDYIINTSYLTNSYKVQLKTLLMKYTPKQLLVVIDH